MQVKSSLVNRVLCLFFAIALLFTSVNIPVNAATQPNQKNIDRIAELTIQSDDGKETTITMFLTKGTKLDETIFQGINNGIKVTDINIKPVNDKDLRNFQALSLDGEIKPLFVDTIFDVGNFTISLVEFFTEPTFWNGFYVVMDGAAVIFPGIPSISGVKRMIKNSDTLKESLKLGVKTYDELKDGRPYGWHRHHIFEKRFASRLGTHEDDMLCIAIPKEYHDPITSAMRKKIPYGEDYNKYTRNQILEAHIDVYRKLWKDTNDEVYEFLYEFSKTKQHSVRR